MDITTFKYCVSEVMAVIAKNNSFAIFSGDPYSIGEQQEEVFVNTWNSIFTDWVAFHYCKANAETWTSEKDSKYGDILIYDADYYAAGNRKNILYHIDLKVAQHNSKNVIGTVTVKSLANYSSTDTKDNHYYLNCSFDAKTHKLYRAKRLLDLLVQWYYNPNWSIKIYGKNTNDYILGSMHYTDQYEYGPKKPTYMYQEHWTTDPTVTNKTYVHPIMMTKRDDDYIPSDVIQHFKYLN